MRKTTGTLLSILLALSLPLSAASIGYDELSSSLSLNNTEILKAIQEHRSAVLDVKDAKSAYHPQISYSAAVSYVLQHQPMTIEMEDVEDVITNPMLINFLSFPIDLTDMVSVNAPYLNAQLSLVQPIYTWGKITNNVRMNEEVAEARALQVSETEAQLDAQLKAYLASLYYLDEMDGVLEGMQSDADELVRLAEESSRTGVLLAQDVASARLSASRISLSRTQVETQKASIIASLETMTGLDGLDGLTLGFVPDEDFFMQIAEADRTLLEKQATGNGRTSMQILTHMANAASYGQSAASRAALYGVPDIALSLSADYTAPLNSAFKDGSAWGVTVAVAMQGTIWDGGAKLNDKARAESAAASAQIARTEAVNTIKSTLADQFSAMDLALANIAYQEANIDLIQAELDTEEAKLALGASSRQAVLQKRLELAQGEIELITNRITLATSAYTIEYLTGYIPPKN